ncbi:hypothetical protein PX093_13160 [Klebsiella pneumoniae]|nr:hypothetical protein [Klebsiella pneumoniae]MCL0612721.1 hypothetical protein [Klebsiella pneumoniae]MCL0634191.1 hypothetical protein [Klebsiella pneumoniae]MCP3238187.1 hypothetical protein [Klebsiella pneumoniae]
MTKSTITRERAQQIFLGNGPEPSASEERELARMALAAMDSEPVAYIFKHPAGRLFWSLTDESNKGHDDVMPVYARPQPAPEEWTIADAVKFCKETGRQDAGSAMDAWNACRAAMLHAGNSPAKKRRRSGAKRQLSGNSGWLRVGAERGEEGDSRRVRLNYRLWRRRLCRRLAQTARSRHAQPVEQENDMSRICAESYQVVGALAEALNIFDDPCVIKALDNLSAQELVHEDVLPFSVDESAQPAPEKYNIGDATMRHIFTPTGMTDVSDMQAVFDRVEAVLVGMDQPAPVVPDSYVMVPMRLTAENGAKGALSGEFSETKFVNCPECFGDEECETCDGSGKIEITVPVTWTTIKAIWVKGVEHFAATAQENN